MNQLICNTIKTGLGADYEKRRYILRSCPYLKRRAGIIANPRQQFPFIIFQKSVFVYIFHLYYTSAFTSLTPLSEFSQITVYTQPSCTLFSC